MPYKPAQQRFVGHHAEEMERLSTALKKHGIDCAPLQKAYEAAFRKGVYIDASDCTHVTHRCHHAAHAYTGIPHKSKYITQEISCLFTFSARRATRTCTVQVIFHKCKQIAG